MTKRIFVAINLSRELIADLARELSRIKEEVNNRNIKWVKPENIHFTLVFLGDTPEDKLQAISYKLQVAAKEFGPFGIKLKNIGVFPNLNQPRIIWIGAESKELIKIGRAAQSELKKAGLKIDEKPFKSHLTIGRIKIPDENLKEKLSRLVEKYQEKEFGQFQAKSIEIMESFLFPEGPRYKIVAKVRLEFQKNQGIFNKK